MDENGVKIKGEVKNGNKWIPLAVAVIGACGGAFGGSYLYVESGVGSSTLQQVARPDPFTGHEARELERRISQVERHVTQHPDIVNQYDRRLATLEAQYAIILTQLDRILDRLEKN